MLLVDVTKINRPATDAALEYIFKANNDFDGGIWNPHESPLIRRLAELFTQRGLDRLEQVQKQIEAWNNGEHFKPGTPTPTNLPGMMQRWDQSELALVKLYLESLPPADWSLSDHAMAVEYVVQRYLPLDELKTEAEWLATKAGLMGKVQASMHGDPSLKQADKVLAALPSSLGAAIKMFDLKQAEASALAFANARAVENVRALADDVRHRMQGTVLQHLQEQQTQAPGTPGQSLQSKLLDQFATLNRDWRRIAITEAGEAQTQGFIASLDYGAVVQRVEQYATACNFCQKIHGRNATVVDPASPNKDGNTEIWVGKNNIGRSASPRKRVGDALVPREEHELYWLPAGLAHPHCRGRWILISEGSQPGDDPKFAAWLRELLG